MYDRYDSWLFIWFNLIHFSNTMSNLGNEFTTTWIFYICINYSVITDNKTRLALSTSVSLLNGIAWLGIRQHKVSCERTGSRQVVVLLWFRPRPRRAAIHSGMSPDNASRFSRCGDAPAPLHPIPNIVSIFIFLLSRVSWFNNRPPSLAVILFLLLLIKFIYFDMCVLFLV